MYFDTVRQLRYEDRRGILRTCVLKECRDVIQRKNAALKPASDRSSAITSHADLLIPGDKDVGKATGAALGKAQILTVGQLAQQPRQRLVKLLGKSGDALWRYANGLDDSPVRRFGEKEEVKSISRGMTFKRDLVSEEDLIAGLAPLVDEVAKQLRRQGLKGKVVQVHIKTPQLQTISRQTKLDHYTYLQHEIADEAYELVRKNWLQMGQNAPVRALTVGVTQLLPASLAAEQLSMFDLADGQTKVREKQERLEAAVDDLRQKMGDGVITLGARRGEMLGIEGDAAADDQGQT